MLHEEEHLEARRKLMGQYPDKLSVLFTRQLYRKHDGPLGHWTRVERSEMPSEDDPTAPPHDKAESPNSSVDVGCVNWDIEYDEPKLAHEIGHYLHNAHTFRVEFDKEPSAAGTIAQAAIETRNFVESTADPHPVEDGSLALDGDAKCVLDTPPDPKTNFFGNVFGPGNQCHSGSAQADVPVTFSSGSTYTYSIEPDEGLTMSYWGCVSEHPRHLSPDEGTRSREAIEFSNRRFLLDDAPEVSWVGTTLQSPGHCAMAGKVNDLALVQASRHQVVTASLNVNHGMKLVAFDVDDRGAVTRRGETIVGDALGDAFALTRGGLRQILAARHEEDGKLILTSHRLSDEGQLQLVSSFTDEVVGRIRMVQLGRLHFATLAQRPSGELRVAHRRIDASGNISLVGKLPLPTASDFDLASYNHATPVAGSGVEVTSGGLLAGIDPTGSLSVQSIRFQSDVGASPVELHQDTTSAVEANAVALDLHLAAPAVRMQDQTLRVSLWRTDNYGHVDKLNGRVMVKDAYDGWWDSHNLTLQAGTGDSFPIPHLWINSGSGSSGEGEFTGEWQEYFLGPVSEDCATLVQLQGEGGGNVKLTCFGEQTTLRERRGAPETTAFVVADRRACGSLVRWGSDAPSRRETRGLVPSRPPRFWARCGGPRTRRIAGRALDRAHFLEKARQ
jgi:hypothetical protein